MPEDVQLYLKTIFLFVAGILVVGHFYCRLEVTSEKNKFIALAHMQRFALGNVVLFLGTAIAAWFFSGPSFEQWGLVYMALFALWAAWHVFLAVQLLRKHARQTPQKE